MVPTYNYRLFLAFGLTAMIVDIPVFQQEFPESSKVKQLRMVAALSETIEMVFTTICIVALDPR